MSPTHKEPSGKVEELGISELHVVEPVLMSCCVLEMMESRYMELDIEDIAEQ